MWHPKLHLGKTPFFPADWGGVTSLLKRCWCIPLRICKAQGQCSGPTNETKNMTCIPSCWDGLGFDQGLSKSVSFPIFYTLRVSHCIYVALNPQHKHPLDWGFISYATCIPCGDMNIMSMSYLTVAWSQITQCCPKSTASSQAGNFRVWFNGVFFWGGPTTLLFTTALLLMLQKSQTTTWDGAKTLVNNGINYQPQLVTVGLN